MLTDYNHILTYYLTSIYVIHHIPAIVHAFPWDAPWSGTIEDLVKKLCRHDPSQRLPMKKLCRWVALVMRIKTHHFLGWVSVIYPFIYLLYIWLYICLIHSFDDFWWFLSVFSGGVYPQIVVLEKIWFLPWIFFRYPLRPSIQGVEVSQMSRSIAGTRTRRV